MLLPIPSVPQFTLPDAAFGALDVVIWLAIGIVGAVTGVLAVAVTNHRYRAVSAAETVPATLEPVPRDAEAMLR